MSETRLSPFGASSIASRLLRPALLVLPLAIFGGNVLADARSEAKYPYDPACPWGRLSNGQGMIHRCLGEEEAKQLFSGKALSQAAASASAPTKPPATGTTETPPANKTSEAPPEKAPNERAPGEDAKARAYQLKVGPIRAEEGDITMGKLAKPLDRYRKCIDDHGGLQAKRAQVQLKFLVQADHGRAEGVEVKKVNGVSSDAAQCLAGVVDRRQVGTPSVPLTAVELSFELTETP